MNLDQYLPAVNEYLTTADLHTVPGWNSGDVFQILPLAQGEYNMNYLVRRGHNRWVFRVNIGTQIGRDDQILYEFKALQLLQKSGVTPLPYFVDDSRNLIEHGVLLMEYLPGGALDYRRDLMRAAHLFARIHATHIPPQLNHLMIEDQPLTMTYEECSHLLPVYLSSNLADPELRDYLSDVLDWAEHSRHLERYFVEDPVPSIINTEVNSGNFIANRERNTLHLVDWEKPLFGDPSQDISHFCAPMTTLWKTDYRMSEEVKKEFIMAYQQAVPDRHLADTIVERVRLRDPFNYLRGISWSAMAWIHYQTGDHTLKNQDTFKRVCSYLDIEFQRELFDPYLNAGFR
ncbi:MAG: aminoglycoside phosphotransferase family protein [Anaerolineae bacterium]|nr:aminoglycoside phosphotransferase family protein [Anaerolineae bacterium]